MTDDKIPHFTAKLSDSTQLLQSLSAQLDKRQGISAIEKDILLETLRSLYSDLLLIPVTENLVEKEQSVIEETVKQVPEPAKHHLPGFSEPPFEIEIQDEQGKEPRIAPIAEPEIKPETKPVIAVEEVSISEKETISEMPKEAKVEERTTKFNEPLPEKTNTPTALNEALAQIVAKKNLSTVLSSRPIQSIESAIGINDKFLFIKELFKGDKNAYERTLKLADQSNSLNEAMHQIGNSGITDFESEAAHKFIELIHRRFSGY